MSQDLRDIALLARAAGDTGRAVHVWRTLLDQSPDDWRLALELKRDLKAGHHYPDSDPRFRRAARALPDDEWLDHYAALYAFHGTDLAAIDARAWSLLARWPQSARLHAIRGDVARQRRDWPGAAAAFATAQHLDPALPQIAKRAAQARLYERLAKTSWASTSTFEESAPYAIHVLNLDRNPERMTEIERHYAASPAPRHRHPGIEGSRLPPAAIARLTGTARAPAGTLGCFLSHAAAWHAVATGPEPVGLIVEDDTIPLLDLPASLAPLNLPDSWDIVFVNDRLAPVVDPVRIAFATIPLAAAMQAFPAEDNAPGADGYLITRDAAATLLDWTARDGFAEDVDWRLLAYSLAAPDISAIPRHSHARGELARLAAHLPRTRRLEAHVLHPPLIRTVGVSSDREDVNRGE